MKRGHVLIFYKSEAALLSRKYSLLFVIRELVLTIIILLGMIMETGSRREAVHQLRLG